MWLLWLRLWAERFGERDLLLDGVVAVGVAWCDWSNENASRLLFRRLADSSASPLTTIPPDSGPSECLDDDREWDCRSIERRRSEGEEGGWGDDAYVFIPYSRSESREEMRQELPIGEVIQQGCFHTGF